MNISVGRRSISFLVAFALLLTAAAGAAAQKSKDDSAKRDQEARDKSQKAARVFREIMDTPDKTIPRSLLNDAEAVGVCPDVIKAGILLVGGRGGSCVISRRIPHGWSAPAFFKLGGGSIGPQIGASSTDFVLLFMNDGAVKGLLEDKFEVGGEIGAAAGPVGRQASASTDAQLKAGILSYSRSKGLFAGLELKGVVINPDNDLNESVYGLKAKDILVGVEIKKTIPSAVRALPLQLSRYSNK
ncbi:MAG: lipid-binding SYLF domain-containing protein [Acidobacteriota bacterium]|nr:lipid-binding SYLF domain-containing protein [Acidobacteriota bacterium]